MKMLAPALLVAVASTQIALSRTIRSHRVEGRRLRHVLDARPRRAIAAWTSSSTRRIGRRRWRCRPRSSWRWRARRRVRPTGAARGRRGRRGARAALSAPGLARHAHVLAGRLRSGDAAPVGAARPHLRLRRSVRTDATRRAARARVPASAGSSADAPAADAGRGRRGIREPGRSPAPARDIALCLTAIALLLRPMGPWFVRPAILAVAVLMILSPALCGARWRGARSPSWSPSGSPTTGRSPTTTSICSATGRSRSRCRCGRRAREAELAFSSRWLIGLAFAFAVLWKVMLSLTSSTAGSFASRC